MAETKLAVKSRGLKDYFQNQSVKEKFEEVLKDKAPGFIATVLQITSSNYMLKDADPVTVINAAMIAAVLDLPINPNFGFAYLVPYKNRKRDGIVEAQFQMGWKGFVQLAMRSRQYKTVNTSDVRTGEIKRFDRLSGEIEFSDEFMNGSEEYWDKRENLAVVGYVAYFKLLNGFDKSLYMSVEQLKKHATRYSQSYSRKDSATNQWRDSFDDMSRKTVLKLLISKFGPMSTEMQKAQEADQAVIEDKGMRYIDNEASKPEEISEQKEQLRISSHIESAIDSESLAQCRDAAYSTENKEIISAYEKKEAELATE